MADERLTVRAFFDLRAAGQVFGEFDKRQDAERCVIALAGREGVLSAVIEESKTKGNN